MKRLIISIALILITITSTNAQSLKSITLNSSETYFQKSKYNNMLSLNLKLTYLYLSKSYSGIGITTEFQYNVSELTSLLFSFNPLVKQSKGSSNGKLLYNISIGSKFYFIKNEYQPYFSINVGLYKEPNIKAYFTISPAFGIEIWTSKTLDVNFEVKSNLHNSGLSIGIPMLTFSFNGGVNLKF